MSPCNAGEVGINMAYYYNTLDNISPGDPCVSSSEGGTVSGYVYEESATCVTENCVLPNIHVLAEQILSPDSKNRPRRTSVRTDENGFYKFPVLPVGEYKIFVTRGVYQAWESLVSITRGEETLQDVYLTPVIAESVLRDTHR